MSGKLQDYFRERYSVEKMNPEQRDYILKCMGLNIQLDILAKDVGLSEDVLDKLWRIFTGNLLPKQKMLVTYMYVQGKGSNPLRPETIARACDTSYTSMNNQINLGFMAYMGELELKRISNCSKDRRLFQIKVYSEVMGEYYPEIDEWAAELKNNHNHKDTKPSRANSGDRMKEALQILENEGLELTEDNISRLARGDFHRHGYTMPSPSTMPALKKKLKEKINSQYPAP